MCWWRLVTDRKHTEGPGDLDPKAKRNPDIRAGLHGKINSTEALAGCGIWRELLLIPEHPI